jgi:hypothetical protein
MVLIVPGGGWQVPGAKGATKSAPKSAGKAAEPAAPAFTTPTLSPNDPDSPIKAAPVLGGAPSDIPITKVEDLPAPKKP